MNKTYTGVVMINLCNSFIYDLIIFFSHDRRLEWKNYEATVVSSKQVDVRNVVNDVKDKLDFRDRIIKLSFAFSHLIVATSSQCYIFK